MKYKVLSRNTQKDFLMQILSLLLATLLTIGASATFAEASMNHDSDTWDLVDTDYAMTDAVFRDVEFANSTHGWIAGRLGSGIGDGIILQSVDGGQTWHEQLIDPSQAFRQIEIVDEQTIMVAGDGNISITADSGKTWSQINVVNVKAGLAGQIFINRTHGWVSTMNSLFGTTNGGKSWLNISTWTFDDSLRNLLFISPSTFWRIGFFGIYYSNNLGVTWTQTHDQGGWATSLVSSNEGWAVDDDTLLHMVNGQSWIEEETPRLSPIGGFQEPYFSDICFLDSSNGWIAGSEIPIVYTPNGGWDWYAQDVAVTSRIMALEFINSTHGYAVGWDGIILRTAAANELGIRLWKGLTDHMIVLPVLISIAALVIVVTFLARRRMKLSHSVRSNSISLTKSET